MSKEEIERLRLTLLANGYTPIPNRDKRTFFKGWPHVEVTEEEIKSWSRRCRRDKATGIRVEGGLMVVDLDIDHPVIDRIVDRIFAEIPELGDETKPLLVRKGKGYKEAWYVRTSELFSRVHGRRWTAPGTSVDAGTHSVEIFGGASPRQFGSFGAHTVDDDGNTVVDYSWPGRSPADTPKSELPTLDKPAAFRLVDIVETELRAAGFEPVERSSTGESDAIRVYDLVEPMRFVLHDGRELSLSELREVAQDQDGLRCSASWLEGPSAVNTSRCIIGTTKSGQLTIWESAAGTTHMEQSAEPRMKQLQVDVDRFAEQLKKLQAKERNKLYSGDSAVAVAAKMLETYAFCPNQKEGVVPLWTNSLTAGMTMSSFRTMLQPWNDEEEGPRGGRIVISPVDIWAGSKQRLTVEGTQMRPDKPRPTFTDERGGLWVNSYDPPVHDAEGGSPDAAIDFVERLIPDERERVWWTRWLAFKARFPHIPGPGVVMVAHRAYGTGRGTMTALMGELFGRRYVKEMPYSMISGRTYQSQYTDWMVDALMVCVNESSETEPGSSTYASKRNTYEHLKGMIEVSPTERVVVTRGRTAYHAMHCTSFIIATNHMDAIPIPEGDRRFAVLMNGEAQTPEYYAGFRAWMAEPANVAAFRNYLLAYDLADYSPFAPPLVTEGKSAMVREAKSDLDHALEDAIASLGEVMTYEQVLNAVQAAQRTNGYDLPDRWQPIAKKMMRSMLYRVGVENSTNWHVKIENRKYGVYAASKKVADFWKTRDGLREAVLKVGGVGSVIPVAFRGLSMETGDDSDV